MGFGFWGCVGWEEEKAAESSFSGVFFSLLFTTFVVFLSFLTVFSHIC
jgi:hypothetical protein